jgi:site-specific recombinase XerD
MTFATRFASLLVNRGISLYVVQGLLGHASPRMTQRYAHLAPQTLLDAAEVAATYAIPTGGNPLDVAAHSG